MAGRSHDLSSQAGEITGQAQLKKDEFLDQASNAISGQNTSHDIKGQAASFLHQTGEQVKNMAQGAADAVKHTLGMDTDNSKNPNLSSNNPNYNSNTNNPNYRSNTNNPSHPSL